MRALGVVYMRGQPCFAPLTFLIFRLWRWGARELVFFDFGDAGRGVVRMASGGFELLAGFAGLVCFGVRSFGFGFAVEVLETAGGFETETEVGGWFSPAGRYRRGVVFYHLLLLASSLSWVMGGRTSRLALALNRCGTLFTLWLAVRLLSDRGTC